MNERQFTDLSFKNLMSMKIRLNFLFGFIQIIHFWSKLTISSNILMLNLIFVHPFLFANTQITHAQNAHRPKSPTAILREADVVWVEWLIVVSAIIWSGTLIVPYGYTLGYVKWTKVYLQSMFVSASDRRNKIVT